MAEAPVRLTQTVKKGGCAAKLPAGALREILSGLASSAPPELLVGTATMDDASLWDLGDGRALVQTLDFFTPIVDDPYVFGQIAAANALSDVFAMGGTPKTAQTILAFPASTLPLELIEPLLAGALERITAAGAYLTGGHSIEDETLKLGFAVSGFVERDRAWTNAGAKPGDCLILTKALGTGTITSAIKSGKATPTSVEAAIESMVQLNDAPELLSNVCVTAATDVTGFGLAGHSLQMARASSCRLEFDAAALPALPGALELLANEVLNRAHHTNRAYVADDALFDVDDAALRWLVCDPQTSGGLLLAVDANDGEVALANLRKRFPLAAIVGRVTEPGEGLSAVVFQ